MVLGVYLCFLAWWTEKRKARWELLSCTHLGSRCWILFLIFKWWGRRKKSRAILCETGLRDCLCKSKLASLFGRVWWITSPSGDSPAPTKGGRSSHSQYLSNQRGALHLMSAWDTLKGLRKEWFHRQAPVVMQNPGEMRRKVCTNGNCFYW